MSNVYATKDRIASMLGTYADFSRLVAERRAAGMERREPLEPFYVLGKFYFDKYGQCWRLKREDDLEAARGVMLPVMTEAEAEAALAATAGYGPLELEGSTATYHGQTAPEGTVCAGCGIGWTMENCHDLYLDDGKETCTHEPADADIIGKTFSEAVAVTTVVENGGALRRLMGAIRPKTGLTGEESMYRGRSLKGGDVISPECLATYCHERHYHRACIRKIEEARSAAEMQDYIAGIIAAFEHAGFTDVRVVPGGVPPTIRALIMMEADAADELAAYEAGTTNIVVETAQGRFPMAMDQGMIDLTEVGIPLSAFADMEGIGAYNALPDWNVIPLDPSALDRLRVLLLRKQG